MSDSPVIPYVKSLRLIKGRILGLKAPCVEALVEVDALSFTTIERMSLALRENLPLQDAICVGEGVSSADGVLAGIASICSAVLRAAGIPCANQYAAVSFDSSDEATRVRFGIPTLSFDATAQAFRWAISLLAVFSDQTEKQSLSEKELAQLERLLTALQPLAPSGTNTRSFREAGLDLGVPTMPLPGQVTQFGWGSASHRFRSSSSQLTPDLGVVLSRDKYATSQLLEAVGLPVARQIRVSSAEEATKAAKQLGYPTVVKATNLDQGIGVEPGLKTEVDVVEAFDRVKQHTDKIVVEEFLPGQDHRINVLRGEVVGAVKRVPGGVTGDGKQTILELVAEVNTDPRRSRHRFSVMKPIDIDDEAQALLREAGLSTASVLDDGLFVPLRRAANVTSGGQSFSVLDQIHPDNAFICVQAAEALNLDIAGVDLIVPDISVSWRESGGGICEVNGMPQIGLTYPDIFHRILGAYLDGDGRIPVAIWVGALEERKTHRRLNEAASNNGSCLAIAYGPEGAMVGGHYLKGSRHGMIGAAQAVLLNQSVDAAVLAVGPKDILRDGSPVDAISAVFVDPPLEGSPLIKKMLEEVRPYLIGPVITLDTKGYPDVVATKQVADRDEAVDAIAKCLNSVGGD